MSPKIDQIKLAAFIRGIEQYSSSELEKQAFGGFDLGSITSPVSNLFSQGKDYLMGKIVGQKAYGQLKSFSENPDRFRENLIRDSLGGKGYKYFKKFKENPDEVVHGLIQDTLANPETYSNIGKGIKGGDHSWGQYMKSMGQGIGGWIKNQPWGQYIKDYGFPIMAGAGALYFLPRLVRSMFGGGGGYAQGYMPQQQPYHSPWRIR